MTHHTMNQMGHNAPNLIGVRPGALAKRVSALLPGYMTMGESGMGDTGEMGMPVPRNSIPMVGAQRQARLYRYGWHVHHREGP
jgi:hypothetical protein